MVTVNFFGGPRHGTSREYARDPITIACNAEADEKGMFGVYRTSGTPSNRATEGVVRADWDELPKPHPTPKKPMCN